MHKICKEAIIKYKNQNVDFFSKVNTGEVRRALILAAKFAVLSW